MASQTAPKNATYPSEMSKEFRMSLPIIHFCSQQHTIALVYIYPSLCVSFLTNTIACTFSLFHFQHLPPLLLWFLNSICHYENVLHITLLGNVIQVYRLLEMYHGNRAL